MVLVSQQLAQYRGIGERRTAGEQEIQRTPQPVDIGPRIGRVRVVRLLGGGVVRRAHDRARRGDCRRVVTHLVRQVGQPEIEHLDHSGRCSQQVGGLDIAVDHALLVGVLQSQGGLPDAVARLRQRQRTPLRHQAIETRPLHVFHDEKRHVARFVGVMGQNDVRVYQTSGGPRLLAETLDEAGTIEVAPVRHLEGDDAVHQAMHRFVDDAHAAKAERLQDAVARMVRQRGGNIDGERGGIEGTAEGGGAVGGRGG